MSFIDQKFNSLAGKKALIPFMTAGFPKPDMTVPMMHYLVENGADIIELGMPFSDPMADGPVIQKASEKAIQQGVNLVQTLQMVSQFRQDNQHTPVVLMGYLNPVESMGYEKFVNSAAGAGVNGVLLVDSPPEESAELQSHLKKHQLEQIFLVAPTTSEARKKFICQQAGGFIYYVALKGVTGAADLNPEIVNQEIKQLKQYTALPIAVGFGVKDAASAVAVAAQADAVVIGSALIQQLLGCQDKHSAKKAISDFMRPIRLALDSL
ncbi:MAG: tryptophan synthase subunit alpha [Proteobacteria bacterium]|nr:MAG: tryptophan synthase subunit alpha [Pseudomonadota bacterium]